MDKPDTLASEQHGGKSLDDLRRLCISSGWLWSSITRSDRWMVRWNVEDVQGNFCYFRERFATEAGADARLTQLANEGIHYPPAVIQHESTMWEVALCDEVEP